MSQTDSFIDEVTEEVRKDRLFAMMRRYGWIAVLLVLLIVGGAAYFEWSKAQDRNAARALGDEIVSALALDAQSARAEALAAIDAPNPASAAMLDLLVAAEQAGSSPAAAAERLIALAENPDAGQVYRQIATLKAVALPGSGIDPATQRNLLEGIAMGSGMTRLLAEEQLALLDVEGGAREDALERLVRIVNDAEATQGLIRRASQMIVVLGGDLPGARDDA